MGAVVLDASVIIAFLYAPDAQHMEAVRILAPWLLLEHDVLIPTSVYSEILVGPLRTGSETVIDRFLAETGSELVPIDQAIARRAAELRVTNQNLRLPDALVLATARERRAPLLTLDRRLQTIDRNE